jgi:hypothetical protein
MRALIFVLPLLALSALPAHSREDGAFADYPTQARPAAKPAQQQARPLTEREKKEQEFRRQRQEYESRRERKRGGRAKQGRAYRDGDDGGWFDWLR